MTQAHPNLFRRSDTFFGTFEGLGQDFGINPLWLRLAFVVPLFFAPLVTLATYLGLSVVVFATRWTFPDKSAVAAPDTQTSAKSNPTPAPSAQLADAAEEMALAA